MCCRTARLLASSCAVSAPEPWPAAYDRESGASGPARPHALGALRQWRRRSAPVSSPCECRRGCADRPDRRQDATSVTFVTRPSRGRAGGPAVVCPASRQDDADFRAELGQATGRQLLRPPPRSTVSRTGSGELVILVDDHVLAAHIGAVDGQSVRRAALATTVFQLVVAAVVAVSGDAPAHAPNRPRCPRPFSSSSVQDLLRDEPGGEGVPVEPAGGGGPRGGGTPGRHHRGQDTRLRQACRVRA